MAVNIQYPDIELKSSAFKRKTNAGKKPHNERSGSKSGGQAMGTSNSRRNNSRKNKKNGQRGTSSSIKGVPMKTDTQEDNRKTPRLGLEDSFKVNKDVPLTSRQILHESTDLQLTDEQKAFFNSTMVKQGLHPAYVLGLRSPPPYIEKMLEQQNGNESPGNVITIAQKVLKPLLPTYPNDLLPESCTPNSYTSHSAQGLQPSPNNDAEYRPLPDVVSWPQVPRHTVPGYVFQGAEFCTKPYDKPSTYKAQRHLFQTLTDFAYNTFSTCWA